MLIRCPLFYEVNAIGSIYGHEDKGAWFTNQIKAGRLQYIDKEKASKWSQAAGL